jgi:hypothetical protein
MNKARFAVLVVAILPVLMAAKCPGGTETNVTCSVTARDAVAVTTECKDNHGQFAPGGGRQNLPGPNIWPGCTVGTFWPSCKDV